jgi:hypothetical protein
VTVILRKKCGALQGLMGCNTVCFGGIVPIFRATLLTQSSGGSRFLRNVGQLQFDAGEIPKRTYTIFKPRRKFEILNVVINQTFTDSVTALQFI